MPSRLEETRFEGLRALATKNLGAISDGEARILHQCVSPGVFTQHGDRRWPVSADFLRWLVTDATCSQWIDPLGLRVINAEIASSLNLNFCKPGFPLSFQNCLFKSHFFLQSATLPTLTLSRCVALCGIVADNIHVDGAVSLEQLHSSGEVRFLTARIGAGLSCSGAQLMGTPSLNADRAQIYGGLFLNNQFCAKGAVRLQNSVITGDLNLEAASLQERNNALFADDVQVTGDIYLNSGSNIFGTLRFIGAQIGGKVQCTGASLLAQGNGNNALCLDGARIKGSVLLDQVHSPSSTLRFHGTVIEGDFSFEGAYVTYVECEQARINGDFIWMKVGSPVFSTGRKSVQLFLTDSSVGTLRDDVTSWPEKECLHIQGFVYKSLVLDSAPTVDAGKRILWLQKQPPSEILSRQPWTQLINLLEANGDTSGAKRVIFAFKQQQAFQGGVAWGLLNEPVHLLQEHPWGVLPVIAAAWTAGSLIFWRARRMRAMAPTDEDAFNAFTRGNELPDHYVPFNPVVYTLENVLPVVDLGQDEAWGPNPQKQVGRDDLPQSLEWVWWLPRCNYQWLSIFRWILILLGWALALILAGMIGGLFKP